MALLGPDSTTWAILRCDRGTGRKVSSISLRSRPNSQLRNLLVVKTINKAANSNLKQKLISDDIASSMTKSLSLNTQVRRSLACVDLTPSRDRWSTKSLMSLKLDIRAMVKAKVEFSH